MTKTRILFPIVFLLLSSIVWESTAQVQSDPIPVDHFEKIIISPHIEAILEKGDQETVLITDQKVPRDKIHIDVKSGTLHIYLEDAKVTTKQVKQRVDGVKRSIPVYKGTQLTVRIIYKGLNELAIRGEEQITSQGLLEAENFSLKMYGQAGLLVNEMKIDELNAVFYGENTFKSKSGNVTTQAFKTYGESTIDVQNSGNQFTRISSYGESEFYINAENKISISAFGDAKIRYKGQPEIEKSISIGDTDIAAIEQ